MICLNDYKIGNTYFSYKASKLMMYDKYKYIHFESIVVAKFIKNCYTLYYIFLLIYISNKTVALSRHIFESIFKYTSIYIFQAIFYARFYI